jgi:hypothetical protein
MIACVSHASSLQPTTVASAQQSPLTKLVLRTLAELALSLALGALSAPAAASPILLWSGIAAQSALNLAIRSFCAATDRAQDNWLIACTFAFGSLHNIQILIHEICHAAAAVCLLQKADPTIRLIPYFSGITSFHIIKPTDLGNWVGVQRIQPLITAAGPTLALLISSLQLTLSIKQLPARPTIARTLIAAACINFIFHALYALSARWHNVNQVAHDFVELKAIGLNPLLAGISILAIPCILISQAVWRTPLHPKSEPSALLPCHI